MLHFWGDGTFENPSLLKFQFFYLLLWGFFFFLNFILATWQGEEELLQAQFYQILNLSTCYFVEGGSFKAQSY